MSNPDRFSSIVCFVGGAMTALWSLKYGIGSFSEPGVGFIDPWERPYVYEPSADGSEAFVCSRAPEPSTPTIATTPVMA